MVGFILCVISSTVCGRSLPHNGRIRLCVGRVTLHVGRDMLCVGGVVLFMGGVILHEYEELGDIIPSTSTVRQRKTKYYVDRFNDVCGRNYIVCGRSYTVCGRK